MKKTEKEVLRKYYEEAFGSNDVKYINWLLNEADEYVKFDIDDGLFLVFEKPRIETSFCFGYSLSRYDTESYDNANDMVDYARTNEEYFLKENLKRVDMYDPNEKYVAFRKYEDSKFIYLARKRDYENRPYMYRGEMLFELNNDDMKKVIEANNKQLENFKKRLNTYLKKYGLSKVKSWSYWRDE